MRDRSLFLCSVSIPNVTHIVLILHVCGYYVTPVVAANLAAFPLHSHKDPALIGGMFLPR